MKLPCIRSGHRILSPIVGYISHKTRSIAPGSEEIATMRRLGQIFSITIEGELGRYIADVANGTYLGVGVQIGHIERDETSNIDRFDSESVEDNSAIGDEHVFSILAPVSGFLIYTTANGEPYCKKGDIIAPGMCIAAVEFMKLRVEIPYEGANAGTFLGYSQASSTRIEAGTVVCRICDVVERIGI